MKNTLQDYIKIYNIIPPEICNSTIQSLNNAPWETHQFYDYKNETKISNEKELSVAMYNTPSHEFLMALVDKAYTTYIKELNFFWFGCWTKHTTIRFNKYSVGTQMKQHCDHIQSIFDGENKGIPIMSCIGVLNDDYKGGELVFFEDQIYKLNKGDILIFPSNFLYPHKVNEVIEGKRYTFVSWAF